MMNFVNSSSLIILTGSLVLSCGRSAADNRTALVSHTEYARDSCWFGADSNLVSFIVFGRSGRELIPYLVSSKCIIRIDHEYDSYGEPVINSVNSIRIIDSHSGLARYFPNNTIGNALATDQPLPNSDSPVYYIRAEIDKVPDETRKIFAIRRVIQLKNSNLTFREFLALSKSDRESLYINLK